MNLAWIDTLLRSALTYYKNDALAFTFMLTSDGIAAGVAGDIIEKNKNLIQETNNDDAFISMIYNMRNGETESLKLKNTYTKADNMFFYKSLTNKKISIALSYHENQSMNAWNRLFMMSVGALLFSFVIITLWLWWYWKKRAKMADKIGEILNEIGEKGSITGVLPSSSQHQDLEELCVKIESMQRGIEQRDRELVSDTKAIERKDQEKELAQNIRQYFYPSVFQPHNTSLSHKIRIDYLDDVGGDFHDFFKISPKLICFVTGTVSRPKKSISNIQTSIDILMTMNLIRSHLKAYTSLNECVFYLNNDLYSQSNGNFTVNIFMGVINCETGSLEFVSAGAPPHYMISHRGILSYPVQHGSPFALKPNEEYLSGNEKFSNGDMLLVHTAGALSRQNSISERYGQQRLQDIMAASKMMNPDMFLEQIVKNITAFTQNQFVQVDDYTLLAIKYEEKNVSH
jgi:serine phosphatase RsbU (regulator of sigma subunit)